MARCDHQAGRYPQMDLHGHRNGQPRPYYETIQCRSDPNLMHSYSTLSDAVNDLQKRGFVNDFKLLKDGIECSALELKLHPDHFEIVEFYHFDGMTDPADEAIVYAIES